MDILTQAQHRFLQVAATVESFRSSFFLTGGTALAAYHLQHRLSEDLDFFTSVPNVVQLAVTELAKPLRAAGFEMDTVRSFPTFAELRVLGHGEPLKVDMAQDTPFRLLPVIPDAAEGIALDRACREIRQTQY